MTRLGHSLGMITTAEGVETEDQLKILRAEGCTQVQGYLFSRPRPAAEVLEMIKKIEPRSREGELRSRHLQSSPIGLRAMV